MHPTINTVSIGGRPTLITSTMVLQQIRAAVSALGADDLGFRLNEVGTHCIHSSTAMQLFLNRIPTYQMMLLGRWSTDAFLRYIRRQVQEFSEGLSQSMVKKEFFTIPEVEVVDTHDPRTRNTASFSTASYNDLNILGAPHPNPAVSTWT